MTSDNATPKSQPTPKAASAPSEAASKPAESAPPSYARGEKQKPVTSSYKNNWNRIYGKKRTKRTK